MAYLADCEETGRGRLFRFRSVHGTRNSNPPGARVLPSTFYYCNFFMPRIAVQPIYELNNTSAQRDRNCLQEAKAPNLSLRRCGLLRSPWTTRSRR